MSIETKGLLNISHILPRIRSDEYASCYFLNGESHRCSNYHFSATSELLNILVPNKPDNFNFVRISIDDDKECLVITLIAEDRVDLDSIKNLIHEAKVYEFEKLLDDTNICCIVPYCKKILVEDRKVTLFVDYLNCLGWV